MHLAFLKVVLHLWLGAKSAAVSTCVPCRCKCQWCGVDTGSAHSASCRVLCALGVWVYHTPLCVPVRDDSVGVTTGENAWSIVMAGGGHRSWFRFAGCCASCCSNGVNGVAGIATRVRNPSAVLVL